jgi:hypothetical protein
VIDVTIIENHGLVALCTITGVNEEFNGDLLRIKTIYYPDREFVSEAEPKYWRVRHAERYTHILEIKEAIQFYQRQPRLF